MYKGLPAQDKNLHLNALQCFLHVPYALHIDNLFVFQTIIYIIDLWRHYVYGIVVSTTLVCQQKKYQILTLYTTIQSLGLDYTFSWALLNFRSCKIFW